MQGIDGRGHELGLHTSFNTYRNEVQTEKEAEILRRAMERGGIGQEIAGGRQHYLRWSAPQTFRNWDAAGMVYDSTLGYADRVGFRCGTCWEYGVYDVAARRALGLRERPLVAMECSVIDERYMGLGAGDEALAVFLGLKDRCRVYGGDFTLLWHNSRLVDDDERRLYCAVLDG